MKIDYKLKAERKICQLERSGEVLANNVLGYDTMSLEFCAQYCKSVSNMFLFGRNSRVGDCYCQPGTRESGRCVLKDDEDWDVYEYIYPGNHKILETFYN